MPTKDLFSVLEQTATNNENIAKLLGEFHKSLTKQGISEELADTIITLYYRQIIKQGHE